MSKMVYRDDIMVNEKGEYYTAEYLDHNDYVNKMHIWTKVEDVDKSCTGKTIRCNYDQIFYRESTLLLCNNLPEAFQDICENIENGELYRYEDDDGNEITCEKYRELQEDGEISCEIYKEIFQWYLIDDNTANLLKKHTDSIIFYCEQLDLYVLGVTHFGTSWDYVDTDFVY